MYATNGKKYSRIDQVKFMEDLIAFKKFKGYGLPKAVLKFVLKPILKFRFCNKICEPN